MNLLSLSFKNILAKPLSALLSILLFGFGVSIIVSILILSTFLKSEITKNAQGIDLVVGAKGSPLQLILCNIFHIDYPTGNISLKEANDLTKNRLIASAIPMSLGDSYKGYRMVGTTKKYANLYKAELASGEWFDDDMEATIGALVARRLGLKIGDQLVSTHGLAEGGSGHGELPFGVVGIMKSTGTALDHLILVSVASIWSVHSEHEAHDHAYHEDSIVSLDRLGLKVKLEQLETEEITSLLIKYRSPMAAIQLPREVNNTSNLQAASPPFETARLFNIIGVGVDIVNILGVVIIILSAASVFIALFSSLKERQYELAIMRAMGASKATIFSLVMMEGLVTTLLGSFFGFFLAHLFTAILGTTMDEFQLSPWLFVSTEYYVGVGSLIIGILASILPAFFAYKNDISTTLSKA